MSTRVFISYKWQDEIRNKWVERLYTDLRSRGIDAILDKFEVAPGQSFSDYMTKSISGSDHVLFIVTPASVEAVESGQGALAFEMQLANARRLAEKRGFSIIPIFREGNATPTYLWDHRYLDFRDESSYESSLEELTSWLIGKIKKPPLGGYIDDIGYYRGPKTQEAIEACLNREGRFKITGWGYGNDPKPGELGKIKTDDGHITYKRSIKNSCWDDWHKHFYIWHLEYNDASGLIVTKRSQCSPA